MKISQYLNPIFVVLFATITLILPTAANARQAVTIFLGADATYLPFVIAENKNFYKSEGLDVSQRLFVTGTETIQSFKSLKANFLASSTYAALPLLQGDNSSVIAIANFYSSPDNQKVIVKSSIKSPADLKGKTIGTRKGTSAEYFLHTYLKKNNIDLSSVKIVDLTPPESVAALVKGDIDAFVFWEPTPTIALKALGDKGAVLSTARGYYVERISLAADKAFASSSPETVEKVLRAIKKATDFINSYPDEAISIGARVFRTDPSVIKVLVDQKPYTLAWDKAAADEYYQLALFSVELGRIKTAKPTSEIFDTRYLQKVAPAVIR
ncbi:ABC transporter substrate-binding protein [Enterobacter ludwigii]|uniref:ABC transporter substrate-binding protein n=1 Tax=Enterobacter ludwigii TaxID=299767 RepID=UPI001C8C5ECB|nr:ABC transporter substrate-binding protein [Enterobacter ludwigii]EES0032877.1 ABC transporter substrate-binding protein [Escherichia coli]EKS6730692.1 ABC transporter substrate-binding protein [Enterobacter mori]MBX8911072.1 ABC transporter substrate-binding protein [Enterobacter ludwigii]MCM7781932.1 ABC transporter substrate-binding protein [Enterobacter ludwigii]